MLGMILFQVQIAYRLSEMGWFSLSAEPLAKPSACRYAAGTEDISQLLEDMGLNLQSTMASRFVRPFADEVRKWEQRLSLVSECIEIWMLVQRKWMYLESIFMDSDDIRHQLPQVGEVAMLLLLNQS